MASPNYPRLRGMHLFADLGDEEVQALAESFERLTLPAGEIIFSQGDPSEHFYIIDQGKVTFLRRERGATADSTVATLEEGDYFGEMSLLAGRRHSTTARAQTPAILLRLGAEDFDQLLSHYPDVRASLEVVVRSQALLRERRFKWLRPDEVVYLLTQKHPILLYQRLAIAMFVGFVGVALAGWALVAGPEAWLWLAGLLILTAVGLSVWFYIDWSNDYYAVTNRRVLWLEKVVGIYESRTEAPLWSIRAVQEVSASPVARALDYGDVAVQTISGAIVFANVPQPHYMASLIEEHWQRSQRQQRAQDQESLRAALHERLSAPPAPPPPPIRPKPPGPGRPGIGAARFRPRLSFQVRFEQEGSVIYRKHWFVLIRRLWVPSVGLLFLAGLIGLRLAGLFPPVSWAGLFMGVAIAALPLMVWWWYEYEDWRNDIYQVTADQIVDRHKKPLGEESRKAAPLVNILSARLERKGILPLIFNYGNVVIQTGGEAGEMRFENVLDPVGVQQDVYRRLELLQAGREQSDAQRRRAEAVELLNTYTQVMREHQDPLRRPPGTGGT